MGDSTASCVASSTTHIDLFAVIYRRRRRSNRVHLKTAFGRPLRYAGKAMFITYHRAGRIAVLPALALVAGLVVIGGIAAMIAAATLVVVGVAAFGISVLRALGLGGRKRRATFEADSADRTIEGVVVARSSLDDEPSATPLLGTSYRRPTVTPR